MIFDVAVRGHHQRVETAHTEEGLRVHVGDHVTSVGLEPIAGSQCWRLTVDGRTVLVRLHAREGGVVATFGPTRVSVSVRRWLPVPSRRAASAGADRRIEILAPMPGLVIETPVAVGDPVAAGGPVAIVEAMKMQMEVPSPSAGRVDEVRVRPGQEVAGGQVLAIVRPAPAAEPQESGA